MEKDVCVIGGIEVMEEEPYCQVLGDRVVLFYVLIDETIL